MTIRRLLPIPAVFLGLVFAVSASALAFPQSAALRITTSSSCERSLERNHSVDLLDEQIAADALAEEHQSLTDEFIEELYSAEPSKRRLKSLAKKLYAVTIQLLDRDGVAYRLKPQQDRTLSPIIFDVKNGQDLTNRYLAGYLDGVQFRNVIFDLEMLIEQESEACTFEGDLWIDPRSILRPKWNPVLAHEALHLKFEQDLETYFAENIEVHIQDYETLERIANRDHAEMDLPTEYQEYFSLSELPCYRKEIEVYEQAVADLRRAGRRTEASEWKARMEDSQEWSSRIEQSAIALRHTLEQLEWSVEGSQKWVGAYKGKPILYLQLPFAKDWTIQDFQASFDSLLRSSLDNNE